jgi:nucleoside-diphosphate-sugar epimerase
MRIGFGELREKRTARAQHILVTGGTGFLGSHIAVALLRAGYRVTVLARSSQRLPAQKRVDRLTEWFGLEEEARLRLAIAEGDILDPGWAAAAASGGGGLGDVEEIVHCASSTAFAERKRAEIEAANVDGLRSVLDFAARGRSVFFHHVSTAFVAGKTTGLCREDWVESGAFTNVYEETKARGEIMSRDICRREGIRLNIYRPSIVYGDSRTGRTLRFNAVYFPVKAAVFLRDIYIADIRDRGGHKAAEMAIRMEEDGRLFMPLRIEAGGAGGLNLVPIDHCINAFMAVLEDGLEGGIYQIANPRSTKITSIVEYAERLFHLDGIGACGPEAFAVQPKNALESLYDSYLEAYRPYMQDLRRFEIRNAAPFLEKRNLVCPEFNYDIFTRCMNYAVETGWGTRIFP